MDYASRFLMLTPYRRAVLLGAIKAEARRRGSLSMMALARDLDALAGPAPSGGAGCAGWPSDPS